VASRCAARGLAAGPRPAAGGPRATPTPLPAPPAVRAPPLLLAAPARPCAVRRAQRSAQVGQVARGARAHAEVCCGVRCGDGALYTAYAARRVRGLHRGDLWCAWAATWAYAPLVLASQHARCGAEYECRMRGAQQMAYPQVVGAGADACTIHYSRNDKVPLACACVTQ